MVIRNEPGNEGIFEFRINATEPKSNLTDLTQTFTFELYTCKPINVALNPSIITTVIDGLPATVYWNKR